MRLTWRKNCKPIAKALLKDFKTLSGVSKLQRKSFVRSAAWGRRMFSASISKSGTRFSLKKNVAVKSDSKFGGFICIPICNIVTKSQEILYGVFSQNQVLAIEALSTGTLTHANIHPREVVRSALKHHAAGVVLARNHPSGNPEFSLEDVTHV